MKRQFKKWYLAAVGLLCVGCCALPIIALLAGTAGLSSIASMVTDASWAEMLMCGLPVIAFLVFMVSRKKKNTGCAGASCNGSVCRISDPRA